MSRNLGTPRSDMTAERIAASDARDDARAVPGWALLVLAAGAGFGWVLHAHACLVSFDVVTARVVAVVPLLGLGVGAALARHITWRPGTAAAVCGLTLPLSQLAVVRAAPVPALSFVAVLPALLLGGAIVALLRRSGSAAAFALAWTATGAALGLGLASPGAALVGYERAVALATRRNLPQQSRVSSARALCWGDHELA